MYLIVCSQESLQFLRLIFNKAVACDDRSGIVVGNVIPCSAQDMSGTVCLSQCRIRVVDNGGIHLTGSQGSICCLIYTVGDQIYIVCADAVFL